MPSFNRKEPLFFLLLFSLMACGGFGVASLDPVEGSVEENVLLTISGAGFSSETRVRLENAERSIDLLAPQLDGAGTLRATAPLGMPKGEYDLVLVDGEREVRLSNAYAALGDVRIISIEVGQGDSTLVVGPTGKSALIDVGEDDAFDETNLQGQPPITGVRSRLDQEGIFAPDLFFASHFHRDHVGALINLLRGPDGQSGTADDRVPPGGIFDRGEPSDPNSPTQVFYRQVTQGLRQTVALSQEFDLGGGVTLRVVAVDGFVEGSLSPIDINRLDENQRTVALLLTAPRRSGLPPFTALFLGDLSGGGGSGEGTVDVEGPLAANIGPVDLVRIAHHGSDTSTSISFLQSTTPKVALISSGKDNEFCHPDNNVLSRLSTFALQARTFLTTGGCQSNLDFMELTDAEEVVVGGDIIVDVSLFEDAFQVDGISFP